VREKSVSIRTFFEQANTRNILTGEPMQGVKLPW
jgi:hypothetical protein